LLKFELAVGAGLSFLMLVLDELELRQFIDDHVLIVHASEYE
jgi:hypothetical protein